MPRPIWKGSISFGLVNVPVLLHAAEQRSDLQLHMVDSRNHARVRYERVNAETGEEVPWNEIVRGYEFSDGNFVLLNDEELKRAAPEATKRIDIEAFVDLASIDVRYFDKPYYLEPAKGGEKGYVLLREALAESGRVGIARLVIRTRQYLAALIPHGDVLIIDLLRYAQEIRQPDNLNIPRGSVKSAGVTPQELKIARTLLDSMAAEWKPDQYHDEYRDALMKWIDKKAASGKSEVLAEPDKDEEEAPAPLNFMELLKKSLEKTPSKPAKKTHKPSARTSARTSARASAKAPAKSSARTRKAG